MRGGIRNIDNDFHQVVPIDDFTLAPMALDFLCFVAGGAGCGLLKNVISTSSVSEQTFTIYTLG